MNPRDAAAAPSAAAVPAAGAIERQARQHVERVTQAVEANQKTTEAQRQYGPGWQKKCRATERAIRIATVAFRRWAAQHHVPLSKVAEALDIPTRTISCWEYQWERNKLRPEPLGRPAERAPVELRNEVIAAFRVLGPQVGAQVLKTLAPPELSRREVDDLVRRLKALHSRKRRLNFFKLHWRRANTVWAMDHSTPPRPIDGLYTQMLSVRDVGGQAQLAWMPVRDGGAEHVYPVLASLFAEHGLPLVIKKDNGSALNDQKVNRLLERNGVIGLLSPPRTPRYNGSCEAGNGSMKVRTEAEAARHGRPSHWTFDDCEAARLQAFQTARPWGVSGPTPEVAWSKREPVTAELRQRFIQTVALFEQQEEQKVRTKKEILPGIPLDSAVEARFKRAAVRRALQAHGLLDIQRGTFSLPFSH